MTYNNFMKDFKNFQKYCVKKAIKKYRTHSVAAKAIGISESALSRAINGGFISDELLYKILGYDIKEKDVKSPADIMSDEIKNEIEELIEKAHSIGCYSYDFYYNKEDE